MPTDVHQSVLLFLHALFRAWLRPRGGVVMVSGMRMRVREGKFREPDVLLLRDRSDPRRQNRYWLGADLVVEVVSPDDPDRDLVEKRADYAEAGIAEYWIADPRDETLTVLAPARGGIRRARPVRAGGDGRLGAARRLRGGSVGGVRRPGNGRLSAGRRDAARRRVKAMNRGSDCSRQPCAGLVYNL